MTAKRRRSSRHTHTAVPPISPADRLSMLSPQRRAHDRERAADHTVDVLVIGGGITGVGVALDAATRGLDTVLVESEDLAYGTSRWSSKLVHGGLRYLAKMQFGVAWESAVERQRVMAYIAPHLTHPLAQVVPVVGDVDPKLVGVGFVAGDVMRRATGSSLPRPSYISGDRARELAPGMTSAAEHAVVGWDGQLVDDARLVVAVARTAAAYGAAILTHTKVTGIDGESVNVLDGILGESWTIRARRVINASGAWAATLDDRITLVRSRGTHLVVSGERLGNPSAALTVPVPGSISRYVFALPEPSGLVFIGLTDVETDAPLDAPAADEDEVKFLLDTINQGLADPLTADDVISTFSGYRPLLSNPDAEGPSADLSRKHAVIDGNPISIVGGKLTAYRRMAQDAVDLITDRPCHTHKLPLVGAQPWRPQSSRLVTRFGAEATNVADLAGGESGLLQPIGETQVLPVELTWAVSAEGAITVDDILDRRLRADFVPAWREELLPAARAAALVK